VRCNIEIWRLHNSILDENRFFDTITNDDGNPLATELYEFMKRRRLVNRTLLARISETHALTGFTGDRTSGILKGSVGMPVESTVSGETGPSGYAVDSGFQDSDNEDEELNDDGVGDLNGLVEFMANIV